MTVMWLWRYLLCLQFAVGLAKYYNNQFAVHIPNATREHVDRIAAKHGFYNLGQIGTLNDYYLFEHSRVQKRSTDRSHAHHQQLGNEPDVAWFEQQVERRRVKRDFAVNQFQLLGPSRSQFPDPFYADQWYLHGGAEAGFDMNVLPAWKKGYTGKGVVVSILDDGIQTNHPDLAQNYDPLASTDINDNDNDPMPRDNGDNKHGTRCAGEVAAVAFNNFCGVGVAYNASIGGVRMLDGTVNDAVEARALSLNPDHIDIYSASWGPEDDGKTVDGPGPLARRAFINGIMRGRKGKGSIFVWASGNGGRHEDSCNCDGYTNSIFTLSISSATQGGFKPWYLEECSSTLATTYSSGRPQIDRSIATVDMDGALRPEFLCTADHTGTSASAPLAAGIIALALEANPNLTWRDMQHLVVFTSRPDPLQESSWVTNGIGKKVSHKFGYGLMDAAAMVTLAEQWTSVPPQHVCQTPADNTERPIPSEFGQKLEVIVETDACAGTAHEIRFLEHVQCRISLRYAPRGNLRIRLTSPSGTPTVLLFERPRDVRDSTFEDWPFMSVHFWGERAAGRWKLEIINAGNRRVTEPGILKKWQLVFYGTDTNPVRLRQPFRGSGSSLSPADFLGVGTVGRDLHSLTQPAPPSSVPFRQVPIFSSPRVRFPGDSSLADFLSVAGSEPVTFRTTVERVAAQNVTVNATLACPRFYLNGTCVSSCPSGYYAGSDLKCEMCHSTCVDCTGPGPDHCIRCSENYFKTVDKNLCVEFCPETYHEDQESKLCIPCTPQCKECSSSPQECSVCEIHLILHSGQCLASCPEGFYENDDYGCNSCHSSCATCRGPESTHCVTCAQGHVQFNGSCVQQCPSQHWDSKGQCLPCRRGCEKCPGGTSCTECSSDWTLDKSSGLCVHESSNLCHSGEYANGTKCFACHSSCAQCTDSSSSSCTSCPAGRVLHQGSCLGECPTGSYAVEEADLTQCVRCPLSCEECRNADTCVSCLGGLHLQDGRCLVSCDEGFYSDRGICIRCHGSCSSCTGPLATDCLRCAPEKVWLNQHCLDQCPMGYFSSSLQALAASVDGENAPFVHDLCIKCDPRCKTCDRRADECTSCSEGFALNGTVCLSTIVPIEFPTEVFTKEAEGRGIRAGKESVQDQVSLTAMHWLATVCVAAASAATVILVGFKVRSRLRRIDETGHGRYSRVALSTTEAGLEKSLLSHSDLEDEEIEIHSASPLKI